MKIKDMITFTKDNDKAMSRSKSPFSHLALAHRYWQEKILPGDIAIDATCGNGQDTLFLSQLPLSKIVAIDIQETALTCTKELLKKYFLEYSEERIQLLLKSHADIDQIDLPKAPRLIVYNLGYLPKGDKSITTKTSTTLISLKKSLSIVEEGGAISLTCYPGHDEGCSEEKALLEFCQTLPSALWSVCHHRWINQHSKAPSLLWLQKRTADASNALLQP